MAGLTKRFGATLALDDASLAVRPGHRARAARGQRLGQEHRDQGAGRGPPGRCRPGPGRRSRPDLCTSWSAADAREAGLRFVHQDLGLFEGLSIAENFAFDAGSGLGPAPGSAGGRCTRGCARCSRTTSWTSTPDADQRAPAGRPHHGRDRPGPAGRRWRAARTRAWCWSSTSRPRRSPSTRDPPLLLTESAARARLGQTVLDGFATGDGGARGRPPILTVLPRRPHPSRPWSTNDPTEDELVELMAGRGRQRAAPARVTRPRRAESLLAVRGLAGGPLRGVDLESPDGRDRRDRGASSAPVVRRCCGSFRRPAAPARARSL